ncbi:MAG: TlyA family RNA methyltransferase [Verrucomicrobia bacterium]|nr:TlyA family RNA methyltransferase [Verrucomicrobiota bacterium]
MALSSQDEHHMHAQRKRLDQVLVDRGFYESRERAKRAVMAGLVLLEDQPATKPGQSIKPDAKIRLKETDPFVSRGGFKLDHALTHFDMDVKGKIAADLGASTGGFTDCLLQRGVKKVFAIDVGQGQLAWKLRTDERVVVMEKTNARHLKKDQLDEPVNLIAVDCSFISLKHILPSAVNLLESGGSIVALIKPQFEAGKEEADKGRGVITDSKIHQQVIESLQTFATNELPLDWHGVIESPILGPAGNKEFLVWLEKH